ncbi:MAG: winged helix-turn-helix transcriptional regulator [Phaeodactylibacter sp.]|nr:winged helix-turn-helix transcriptional regulator [Phaeodactylibacter sp.]
MPKTIHDPHESLIFLTNRVGRLLATNVRRAMHDPDAQKLVPHLGLLVDLWMHDGVRQQDLAVSVIKDKGAIARSLDHLEKENLVIRQPDAHDKRNKRIFLTPKGKGLREEFMPVSWQVQNEAQEGISEDELAICKKVLNRMYTNLMS